MLFIDLMEFESGDQRLTNALAGIQAICRFRRQDHLGPNQEPLTESVARLIESKVGRRPTGSIRLLTQLAHFGYYFSPLNVYFCYDSNDELEFAVAEVNNTPWREQCCYVLSEQNAWTPSATEDSEADANRRYRHPKEMHVSPFMQMEVDYGWTISEPDKHLNLAIENLAGDDRLFAATMQLKKRELSRRELRRMTRRFPILTARIMAAIYWQAFKLWWKKCPTYQHPSKRQPLATTEQALSRNP